MALGEFEQIARSSSRDLDELHAIRMRRGEKHPDGRYVADVIMLAFARRLRRVPTSPSTGTRPIQPEARCSAA